MASGYRDISYSLIDGISIAKENLVPLIEEAHERSLSILPIYSL